MSTGPRSRTWDQRGVALLAVLVLLLLAVGSAVSFIFYMSRQQSLAGGRYRATAARAVAEGGIHLALAALEAGPRDEHRRLRSGYTEPIRVGALEGRVSLRAREDPDGALVIDSTGAVAGLERRLRARVYLTSPALLAALFARGLVRQEPRPAALSIGPYGRYAAAPAWAHVATEGGVWFGTENVSINDAKGPDVARGPGPIDGPDTLTEPSAHEALRVVLAAGGRLYIGDDRRPVGASELRMLRVRVDDPQVRPEIPVVPLVVDGAYYARLAASNQGNARLNAAAGEHIRDPDLARKRDSAYAARDFESLLSYATATNEPLRVVGVIRVLGGISVAEGQRVEVSEGAIIADGTVRVAPGGTLSVTHSAATRALPGVLIAGDGDLIVTEDAELRAHGLVAAGGTIRIGARAAVGVVGSVWAAGTGLGVSNLGTLMIRYDAAVRGTPGLRVPDGARVVPWVAHWEELP